MKQLQLLIAMCLCFMIAGVSFAQNAEKYPFMIVPEWGGGDMLINQ